MFAFNLSLRSLHRMHTIETDLLRQNETILKLIETRIDWQPDHRH